MHPLRILLPLVALSAASPVAQAQYRDSPFSYNYLDANWSMAEFTELYKDPGRFEGYAGRLSFDSPEGVRVILGYEATTASIPGVSDDMIRQDMEAGVGFMTSPSDTTDLVLDIKFLRGEMQSQTRVETTPGNFEDRKVNKTKTGYGIEFGSRSLLLESLEFNISGEYREYFISEIGGHAGMVLMFTPNFGLNARYTYFESMQSLNFGLRFSL